jgi:rubrerythrin
MSRRCLKTRTLKKQKPIDSWEDVIPQKQYIPLEDLQEELVKLKQQGATVKQVLNDLKSKNCRSLINHLVEEQNYELEKQNKALRYVIAGIFVTGWYYFDHRRKERFPRLVQVILQTEPSGSEDLQTRSQELVEPARAMSESLAVGTSLGSFPEPPEEDQITGAREFAKKKRHREEKEIKEQAEKARLELLAQEEVGVPMGPHALRDDIWVCGNCKTPNFVPASGTMCPVCAHSRDYQVGCCINPGEYL